MLLRWLLMWLLLGEVLSGCGPSGVTCEQTTGSCLDLQITQAGSGTASGALTVWVAGTDWTGTPIRLAGTVKNAVNLPASLAVIPPPYLREVSRISAQLLGEGQALALTGRTNLTWPTGEHIQASVSVAPPSLAFTKTAELSVGEEPRSVVLFDANQDGKLDLVVATDLSSGQLIKLFLGQGNGTFGPPQKIDGPFFGDFESNLVAADLNADGMMDLAYASWMMSRIYVLLGKNNGTFQPLKEFASAISSPSTLAARDLDGDKKVDLAVKSALGPIAVMWNLGDASFPTSTRMNANGIGLDGPYLESFAVQDLNGDGLPDVVAKDSSRQNISIWLNKGGRSFSDPFTVEASFFSSEIGQSFTVRDFDGDTVPDLVVGGYTFRTRASVSFLKGDGHGQFGGLQQRVVSYDPGWLGGPDLNDDLIPDLCTVSLPDSGQDAHLYLAFGNGAGGFQAATCGGCQLPNGAISVEAQDLDGDKKLDLVIAARTIGNPGSVVILRNATPNSRP